MSLGLRAVMRDNVFGSNYSGFWYLFPEGEDDDSTMTLAWPIAYGFTFLILYTNFVPLTMYITMEIINFGHSVFINSDALMYVVCFRRSRIWSFIPRILLNIYNSYTHSRVLLSLIECYFIRARTQVRSDHGYVCERTIDESVLWARTDSIHLQWQDWNIDTECDDVETSLDRR